MILRASILTITAGILAAGLSGCPGTGERDGGASSENILPIPATGTEYLYDGNPLEWGLADHPRIMARPEGIEYLKSHERDATHMGLMEAAEMSRMALDNDPNFREATAPLACAWGYVLTGDEGYLQTVRNSLSWLLEFPPIYRVPEGANFPFMQQAYALGGLYDLLYSEFTEEEISEIERVLTDTVFNTLAYKVTEYDENINFWALDVDTNYYLFFHATAGLIAIDLYDVVPEAPALAEHCYTRVNESMDAFASENGWREGLTYLDFCWGQSACYFLLAIERNTSETPYEHPWFRASVPWSLWGMLPDRRTVACFGDNEPENYSVGSWMARLAALTGDMDYLTEAYATAAVIADSGESAEMSRLALDLPLFTAMTIGREPSGPMMSDFIYEGTMKRYLPGIEWGFIRTGPSGTGWEGDDDFYLAFKSGVAGYDHNHLDQGSMILAAYSNVLLSDPGRGGPDQIRQDPALNCLFEAGLGHNTLIVGDGCYMDLELFPDNPYYYADPGAISSVEETDEFIQFTTDNSGLYPHENLADYKRSFIYLKPGVIEGAQLGVLIVADRIAFSEEKDHSLLFHCPGSVETVETGVAKLINGDSQLNYFGWCSIPTADKVERQETTWPSRDSFCYFRSTAEPVSMSDWVHVMIPAYVADEVPRPTFEQDLMGIKVVWEGYEVTLYLKPVEGYVFATLPG